MSRTERTSWVGPDRLSPIAAVAGRLEQPAEDTSFDCVQLGFIRSGSSTVSGDFALQQVQRGDVVVFAPLTLCRVEPGPDGVGFTTVFVDQSLLVDFVAWEHSDRLRDRHEAEELLARRCPDAIRAWSIGEQTLRQVEPWLDELEGLSIGRAPQRFKRSASLLLAVLDAIEPVSDILDPQEHDLSPRHRRFEPLRPEAARAAELLRSELRHPWTMVELAGQVGLSPNHLRKLFVHSFGRTPWAHLNLLRAQQMSILLQDSELSIPDVMQQVGWSTPSHAAKMFRRYAGMSPRQFRNRHGATERPPPTSGSA